MYLLAHGDSGVVVRRAAIRPTAKGYTEARTLDAVEGLEATLDEEGRRAAVAYARRVLRSAPESLERARRIVEHLAAHGPAGDLATATRAAEANRAYLAEVTRLLVAAGETLDG